MWPLAVAAAFVACGARTGLLVPDETGPLYDGGPLDVQVDCPSPTYCEASDPGYIYKCGQRIYQCSSLEQCEELESGATCVNPCLDSLGNDTSNGCEFYAGEMDTTPEGMGACYAVFLVHQRQTGPSVPSPSSAPPASRRVTAPGSSTPCSTRATVCPKTRSPCSSCRAI